MNGPGSLTITGSNLTWCGGGIYQCEITDVSLGAGIGWDLVTVSTQLFLNYGIPNLVIRMDSQGAPPVNFNPGADYTLKIMGYTTNNGMDLSKITLNTNSFLGSTAAWIDQYEQQSVPGVPRGGRGGGREPVYMGGAEQRELERGVQLDQQLPANGWW